MPRNGGVEDANWGRVGNAHHVEKRNSSKTLTFWPLWSESLISSTPAQGYPAWDRFHTLDCWHGREKLACY